MRLFSIIIQFVICAFIFGGTVTKIQIEGNKQTKDRIILREIHHQIPSEFDKIVAEEDRNRIYNLGLFSTVTIENVDSIYMIKVIESPSWMPFPIFDYNESKGKNGWSYGGGVSFLNYRGLNEKLYIGGTVGETKSYFFNFVDPWMWGDHGSIHIGLSDNTFEDAVYAYELQRRSISFGAGFYKGLNHQFKFEFGYKHHKISKISDDDFSRWIIPDTTILEHQHISSLFEYVYDSRDIYVDPTEGLLIFCEFSANQGLVNSKSYHTIDLDITKYYELKFLPFEPVLSLNSSIFMQFSNHLPIFCKAYIGGEDYVRGYSSIPYDNVNEAIGKIEVNNLIFHSLEYQHTLIPKKDFGGVEMGIDFVLFADYGYGENELSELDLTNGIFGYGYGFKFFMSSIGAIGFDFGFNPYESGYLIHLSMSN